MVYAHTTETIRICQLLTTRDDTITKQRFYMTRVYIHRHCLDFKDRYLNVYI